MLPLPPHDERTDEVMEAVRDFIRESATVPSSAGSEMNAPAVRDRWP